MIALLTACFLFCNPCVRAELHQQKRARKLCSATLGDSSVLHCASLLRTIFASSALANEHVHVHNERNLPRAKLDSEINVLFLLNEHGDVYFLSHNSSVHGILFNLEKIIGRKKDIGERVHKPVTL